MDTALLSELDECAKREGRTRSGTIEVALKLWLDALGHQTADVKFVAQLPAPRPIATISVDDEHEDDPVGFYDGTEDGVQFYPAVRPSHTITCKCAVCKKGKP